MVTTVRGGQANYDTTAGGSIPVNGRVRDLGKYAEDLTPRKTPLLTRIGMGSPLDVDPPEWGQHARTKLSLTLGSALGDNGGVSGVTGAATSITLATGQGVNMYQFLVLEVIDFYAGSTPPRLNQSTRELIWLTQNPSGDTATSVYRGYAGTTAQAHGVDAQVTVFTVAEPQLSTHPQVPVVRGTTAFNYFQRLSAGLKWDRATLNTRTFEFPNGSPREYDIENATIDLKLKLERSLWTGGRQAGDQTGPVASAMGGIDQFITTNVTNANGAAVTPRSLEAELRNLWKTVDDAAGKILLMDYDTASIFDGWNQAYKQSGMNDTQVTYLVEKVKFREGIYDIGVSRFCPAQTIYIVNLDDMKVHPRRNNNWTLQKKDGNVHGVANDEYFIYGDFTFILKQEEAMAKLYNFTVDPSAYPLI